MQQTPHNKMTQPPRNKIARPQGTRDQQLAALGVSPTAAKLAMRLQQLCSETNTARFLSLTKVASDEWHLVEMISGKVEVIK